MTSIVFTQFKDNLPVDVNKYYYISKYTKDIGLQEIHKLCLFPEKLKMYLDNFNEKDVINCKTNKGYTALMLAIINDVYESVKMLLAVGADINVQSYYGHTPLILACKYYTDIFKYTKILIEYEADISIVNDFGCTVTSYLNYSDEIIMLKLFLQNNIHTYNPKSINIFYTVKVILLNINNLLVGYQININQLKKLKHFDYNSILLYELQKCVF